MSKQDWGCLAASTTFDVTSSKGTKSTQWYYKGASLLPSSPKWCKKNIKHKHYHNNGGDPKFRLLSRQQNVETLSTQKSRSGKYAEQGRRLALDKRRRRKGKTWLGDKFWGKLHSYTHSLKYLFTHYLTACLLKLFYTFQCGQNGKEHSDPVEILPAQRSWNNEALKVENKELEYKT